MDGPRSTDWASRQPHRSRSKWRNQNVLRNTPSGGASSSSPPWQSNRAAPFVVRDEVRLKNSDKWIPYSRLYTCSSTRNGSPAGHRTFTMNPPWRSVSVQLCLAGKFPRCLYLDC